MTHCAAATTSTKKSGCKLKEVVGPSPLKEFASIDVKEDSDVNFPSTMNVMTDEDQPMYDDSNELLDRNGSEGVHTFRSTPPISGHMKGSSTDMHLTKAGDEKVMTSLNQEPMYMDTMVPEVVMLEEGDSFAREM